MKETRHALGPAQGQGSTSTTCLQGTQSLRTPAQHPKGPGQRSTQSSRRSPELTLPARPLSRGLFSHSHGVAFGGLRGPSPLPHTLPVAAQASSGATHPLSEQSQRSIFPAWRCWTRGTVFRGGMGWGPPMALVPWGWGAGSPVWEGSLDARSPSPPRGSRALAPGTGVLLGSCWAPSGSGLVKPRMN